MRSGIVQYIYRCEPYRGGQNFHVFSFFAKIESLRCPDLRPSQLKSQLCLVILK